MQIPTKIFHCLSQSILWSLIYKSKTNTAAIPKAINKSNTTNSQTMQIPKIFHYHSQYYVHYKSYKGRHEEREREWEREIEIEPRARTKHNISKFPNSQNPKVKFETYTDYPALKNSIHKRETENLCNLLSTNTLKLSVIMLADLWFFCANLWPCDEQRVR